MSVTGTENGDSLSGGLGNDTIEGLAGDDVIRGLGGDDHLHGNGGSDTLYGDSPWPDKPAFFYNLGSNAASVAPVFTPDGQSLLESTYHNFEYTVSAYDLASGAATSTILDGDEESFDHLVYSAGGQWLVFNATGQSDDEGDNIDYVGAYNSHTQAEFDFGAAGSYTTIGTADDILFFGTLADSSSDSPAAYLVNLDTQSIEQITTPINNTAKGSSDGSTIAYYDSGNLMIGNVADSTRTTIAAGKDGNAIAFSSDGKELAFFNGDTHTLYVMDVATQDLTTVDQGGAYGDISFSSDGKELLFTDGTDIRIADLASDNIRTLATGSAATFSPDGSLVAFVSDKPYGTDNDSSNDVFLMSATPSGNDHLYGGHGDDHLYGGAGTDVLYGGSGKDTLDGGTGADVMVGGSGADTYIVDNKQDKIVEVAGGGHDVAYSSVSYSIAGNHVNDLYLTGTKNISATGNDLNNHIVGNSGNNVIDGGAGAGTMEGGGGQDTFYVDNAGDVVIETGGAAYVNSSVSFTMGANVWDLTLTGTDNINATGNDISNGITGNSGNNVIDGGGGNDTMVGRAGNDTYYVDSKQDKIFETAGGGHDTVTASVSYKLGRHVEDLHLTGNALNGTGNNENNHIVGDAQDNVLDGGFGNDTLTGGAGHDTFVFDTALSATHNVDTITHFSAADNIRLSSDIFTALTSGDLPKGAFFEGSAAHQAGDRIIYDSSNGHIYYDPDGTGAQTQTLFAIVTPGTDLHASDFLVL